MPPVFFFREEFPVFSLKPKILKFLPAGIVCLLIVCILFGFRIFKWEPESIEVNRHEVFLKNWHGEHNGLRFVIVSDIHQLDPPEDIARLKRVVRLMNDEKPDVILLLGDFIGERFNWKRKNASPEAIAAILKELKSARGVFAVLGNHDWWHGGDAVRKALEDVGIKVLENESAELSVNGKKLNLIGLPDRITRGRMLNTGGLPDAALPAIVLSHNPDYFEELKLPYEFMLAGHTHGGQVQLPWIGALIVPSKYGAKYASGFFEDGGRKLFVTRGTGTSIIKARFLCPPEIAVITIRKEAAEDNPSPAASTAL